jgi:hypothetical protein
MFKETPIKLEKALPRTKGDEGEEQAAPKAANASGGTSTPNPNKEGSRREKSKKSRRGGGHRETTTTTTNDSDAIRPDPRWASELEKLKQILAAQATN